ncbi:acyl-CoA synthetase [Streptomyces solincola]|uniref:Acyl-CoA synthetase n=1 Tax=Streptomyces solincola TaxID=2100817 RepID=A0A2S9PXZ5_9ACTN|nr:AMP-binding protein [Streptomyces solincola]PRH79290.1 acyl-CoA synthetase [Streptomyces solincola]
MTDHLGLVGGFLTQVREQPDAPALVWHDQVTTYAELSAAVGRERERLALLGAGPGEPVGVLAAKSPAAVALVLACLTSGRPLLLPSPALADTTLTELFAQAGCRHVLAPEGEPARLLPPADPDTAALPVPAGAVLLLTTSGSTGLPKIVPLTSAAVDRFTAWAGPAFGIGPGATVLNHAPLNFDLCLLDVWTTLAHGGRVVLVDPDHAVNGRHLLGLLQRHQVHVVQAVPMAYGLLEDAARRAGAELTSVRHALFTGDAMPDRTLAALPRLFPRARLYNVYGCTETNDSFLHELAPGAVVFPPAPIGRPLPGVQALVLDAHGDLLEGPGGGELYVSTPFQAPGYLDAARHRGTFTGHPLGLDDRAWFRTGDLVRRDADGMLHLTGRVDFQVKVRGTAVNTAEVERVLQTHPAVLEAGVTARPDPLTGRRLVASVRRAPGKPLNSLQLKEHCARNLPKAAVPSELRITDDPLPKTPTGKVDRAALDRAGTPAKAGLATAEGRTP